MKYKRVVAVSDLHCGHRAGLTPPKWQLNPENAHDAKWAAIATEQWKWYCKKMKELQPIDVLLVLGDCCDGVSERANSRDSIRVQRPDQVAMATECLQVPRAKRIDMVFGTRSHVADWEIDVAQNLGAKIGAHSWPAIGYRGGEVVFDCKHKVGSSTIPHGRSTAIRKSLLWNRLWAERNKQPAADFLLRGHVHYFSAVASIGRQGLVWCMTLPALQGMGSEYGAEQCEGLVDYGFLVFDVHQNGRTEWQLIAAELQSHAASTTKY
jgi:hypothetical protein